MRHAKWVSALEIDRWADTNEARPLLPELIRRLVHATVEKIHHFKHCAHLERNSDVKSFPDAAEQAQKLVWRLIIA